MLLFEQSTAKINAFNQKDKVFTEKLHFFLMINDKIQKMSRYLRYKKIPAEKQICFDGE